MSSLTPATYHLRSQILYHLDADLPDTANFLAGRLNALEPRNPDSAHLLALTYSRLRRFKAAADSAQKFGSNGRHLGCAYVFAQSCLQLGRFVEGVAALEKGRSIWTGRSQWKNVGGQSGEGKVKFVPDAPAVWCLLGKLWHAHGDLRKAGDCYVEAHKGNPFLWEAFEGLCKVGADLKVENMFRPTSQMVGSGIGSTTVSGVKDSGAFGEIYTDEPSTTVTASQPLAPQLNFNQQVFTPSADPFQTAKTGTGEATPPFLLPSLKAKESKSFLSEWDTPTTNGGTVLDDEDVAMSGTVLDQESLGVQPPAAPARRARPGQNYEASDRPRPPALRGAAGHVQSASEGTNDESQQIPQHQRKPSVVGGHKRTVSGHQAANNAANNVNSSDQQPIRRSNRLFGQGTTSSRTVSRPTTAESTAAQATAVRPAKPATGTKGRIGSTVGRVVSGNRKVLPPDRNSHKDEKEAMKRAPSRNGGNVTATTIPPVPTATADKAKAMPPQNQITATREDTSAADLEALNAHLSTLRLLAQATYATTRFDTPLAAKLLRALPSSQRETPYVLAQLGRAYYESGAYKDSEEAFARLLKLQPSRVKDMEVYSTVLWHLKKDASLAFLCHLLRETDNNAPETWCAVGNAFSLAREHDQAISAFKRAVQVTSSPASSSIDPSPNGGFAYAWTLMGHEYIANEDFDAATSCFRHAVSSDRRGYGGWYGLGKCSERVSKLEDAERYYRIASSINPANSTLLVCIGVVLEKLRNRKGALANYSKALELAPGSALARFKKARVLMHLRYFDEALVELEVLRSVAPEEANVWFLLGKCYKGLGERGESLGCFTRALNLDVKVSTSPLNMVVSGWQVVMNSMRSACGSPPATLRSGYGMIFANFYLSLRPRRLSRRLWKHWRRMTKSRATTSNLNGYIIIRFVGVDSR